MGEPRQKETGNTHQTVKRRLLMKSVKTKPRWRRQKLRETANNSKVDCLYFSVLRTAALLFGGRNKGKCIGWKNFADKYIISKIYFKALQKKKVISFLLPVLEWIAPARVRKWKNERTKQSSGCQRIRGWEQRRGNETISNHRAAMSRKIILRWLLRINFFMTALKINFKKPP